MVDGSDIDVVVVVVVVVADVDVIPVLVLVTGTVIKVSILSARLPSLIVSTLSGDSSSSETDSPSTLVS